MKKALTWAIGLQIACSVSWFIHISYLRHDYGESRLELGKQYGEMQAYSTLSAKGVELPDGLRTHPDKHRVLDLGTDIHAIYFFYPAVVAQFFVIGILVHLASRPAENKQDTLPDLQAPPHSP